jgi:DNA-binding XRE family transcriptional regulator
VTATDKAALLLDRLRGVAYEFKTFVDELRDAGVAEAHSDAKLEAKTQADSAACQLAALCNRLNGGGGEYDLFVDAARDAKDRAYSFDLLPPESFPARLKSLRESAGLTVAELAEKVQMPRTTLYRYEAGERSPTWDVVQELAGALGVPTDAFRSRQG